MQIISCLADTIM